MGPLVKLIIGLCIVSLIGLAAVSLDGLPGSASSAEQSLQRRATEVLGVSAADWATLRIHGQKAVLTGEAPSDASREALIKRVAQADWGGGLAVGGITTVDSSGLSAIPALPVADPFSWIAEYENGDIQFSGYAPSMEARETIFRLSSRIFSNGKVSGELDIASGAPAPEEQWVDAAFNAIRALSMLDRGGAQASDESFSVSGETQSADNATAVRTIMASIDGGLVGSANVQIIVPPTDAPEENAAPPDARQTDADATAEQAGKDDAGTDLASTALENTSDQPSGLAQETAPTPALKPDCTTMLQTALDAKRIGFSSARTDIDIPSRAHLRDVAALLNTCPKVRLFITGHTDASGNASRNLQLSGYRADAVRAFLTSVGAPADRISARGVGASQPRVSNETPAGREQNRRIEIEILSMDE